MSDMEYNKLMTHSITLRKIQRDSVGDFLDVSSEQMKGFVEYDNKLKIIKNGEEINASAIVYLKDDCGIDIDYPYWMIDQTAPQTRSNMEVLEISPIDDPRTGLTHHFECIVK